MKDGFVKVAAGTPRIRVADCAFNAASLLETIRRAERQGVKLLTLPELCLTGYTCGDLFLQPTLLRGAEQALAALLRETTESDMLFAVGLPAAVGGKLYNCAAVCCRGKLLGLVPKRCLPNYSEFYEQRWFVPGERETHAVRFAGQETLFGAGLLFSCREMPALCVGVELCEDLWAPVPPSCALAQAGATVILNLSASDELASKDSYRRMLVRSQSGRLLCGYVYADAGEGESTTDLVFAGHDLIAENGVLLAERRFETGLCISEVDVAFLSYERSRITSFSFDRSAFTALPF